MAECIKCGKSSEEVKLLDALSFGEIVKICEECSINEDTPVIRRPTTSQLKESERPYSVIERLRRMAGLEEKERKEAIKIAKKITNVTLDDLRKRQKTREQEIKERYELARKRNIPLNLIDNFNWHIFMARRKRKLTRHELAELLGESETAIKMIENKEMPDDSDRLIKKLEQFFNIKLKKEKEAEEELEEERIEQAVKERLNKEKKKVEEKKEKSEEVEEVKEPARVLKFDKDSIENLTISDLQRMKEEKEETEKLEKQKEMKVDELLEEVKKEEKEKEKERWEKEASKLLGKEIELED